MQRKLWVSVHLYLAAFFAPMVIMVAISGGLYLLGYKGSMEAETLGRLDGKVLDTAAANLDAEVDAALQAVGVGADYEYLKIRGANIETRPTSRLHYRLIAAPEGLLIERVQPSLQAAIMELHKGHGPGSFKLLQKIFALGLLLIMLSGLYLGLSSRLLWRPTALLSGAGALLFIVLALL